MPTAKYAKTGKQFLSLLLTLAMILPLMPVTALAAEAQPNDDLWFISQTVESHQSMTVGLTAEEAAAVAGAADVTWKLVRTGSFMNPGENHEYISIQGEEVPFPNELQEIDLENVPQAYKSYLNISNVSHTVAEEELTLSFDVAPMISRNNPSTMHSNGGAYTDVSGYFKLMAVVGETEIEVHDNVEIRPYESFHSMWEVYDELQALAEAGDDLSYTATPYVAYESMGQSTAGYEMPYLIIAKSSEAVENWLELCELAETQPEVLQEMIEEGTIGDYQIPVMYSNVHSNETAAVDGIMNLAQLLVHEKEISYDTLTAMTEEGQKVLEDQREKMGLHTSALLIGELAPTFLGGILPESSTDGSQRSGKVENFEDYYVEETFTVKVDDLLDDVIFILVPEENVEGRINLTRAATNGYDLNRDNSFQTTAETQNMQHLIGMYNPATLLELHGQVVTFQVEPCSPPHEPNFEYDLLSKHLLSGGEAFGAAAVANNDLYQSYAVPMRDYLTSDDEGNAYWEAPWDDMSTSYTPQFAMLQGTVAYTVELPAYSEATTDAATYGLVGLSAYVADEKNGYFDAQLEIFERCLNNENSDDEVGPWLVDSHDNLGAEADLFRPANDGEGENGQFFPECYIIPLDAEHQNNLDAAFDMIEWLTRNDVKVHIAEDAFVYDGVTYPAGTMIVSMYQAKRAVANGALYEGTVIRDWTELYSEGITAFNYTRGFDMITVNEPAAYAEIEAVMGTALDYESGMEYLEENAASAFSGVKNAYVVIKNSSEDAVAAVNALLADGKTVGMITEETSEFYGSFVCSYADWQTVEKKFVITGIGLTAEEVPAAQVISEMPTVYINGTATAYKDSTTGAVRTSLISSSTTWNYDDEALKLMGFATTKDAAEADVIVGGTALDAAGLAAVQKGTPYIGYSSSAYSTVNKNLVAVGRASTEGMDCLGYVEYPENSMINSSYVAEGDNVLYGYGTYYFTSLPEGAVVLVQGTGEYPMEGFLNGSEDSFNAFLSGIKGFAYTGKDMNGNDIDIALFANTLTNKLHQRDEFAYISNFIFSKMLDEAFVAEEQIEEEEEIEETEPSYMIKNTVDGVKLSARTAEKGEKVYIELDDLSIEEIVVLDKKGNEIEIKENSKGYYFVMPEGKITIEVIEAESTFADVDTDDYYFEAIEWAVENGITNGMTWNTFGPEVVCSRAQVVTFLWRAAGSPEPKSDKMPFADVAEGAYYYDAVLWAMENGITNGMTADSFAPDGTVTRGQTVTFLWRAAGMMEADAETGFTDVETDAYYADAVAWAVENSITNGLTKTTFGPENGCTRGQIVTFLYRHFE